MKTDIRNLKKKKFYLTKRTIRFLIIQVQVEVSLKLFIKPFNSLFVDLILNLRVVESVCISCGLGVTYRDIDMYLTNGDFVNAWLSKVS